MVCVVMGVGPDIFGTILTTHSPQARKRKRARLVSLAGPLIGGQLVFLCRWVFGAVLGAPKTPP